VKELVPVATGEPPVATSYQSIVDPDGGRADSVTGPGPQRVALVTTGSGGRAVTARSTTSE
jgi:hypothetical protein